MPSLGLAMIVKNGAKSLRHCLASVAGVIDHIVIADTGSTDGTSQLARDLGAHVFDFPWQDDFSQARNASIKALATDWVLVMDHDEELDAQAVDKIPALLTNPRVSGYSVIHRNYLTSPFGLGAHAPSAKPLRTPVPRAQMARAFTDFSICRLFRRHPDIYYVGKVHELVEPRIQALGLQFAPADVVIHHFGHLASPADLRFKDVLYRKLGRLKIQDTPGDPQAWIEMGLQEYEQFKNYSAGIECFTRALALNPHFSHVPYLSLANLYLEIQADDRALELLSRVTMNGSAEGEREHLCGDAFHNLGRLKEARAAYTRALHILPADPRIISKLGLTEVRLGLKKNGMARLGAALKAVPEVLQMHERMIQALVLSNMTPQAAKAAERLVIEFPSPATILRAASLHAQSKEWQAAQLTLSRGLRLFPQSQELLQAMAELECQTLLLRPEPSGAGLDQSNPS